ncbi:MAG: hypothetical protein U0165_03990 [Polyangiaceae bacterium]
MGVYVDGADATIKHARIEHTQTRPSDGTAGWGVLVSEASADATATLTIEDAVIRQNHTAGLGIAVVKSLRCGLRSWRGFPISRRMILVVVSR